MVGKRYKVCHVNEKHYSNENEVLKHVNEVILSYIEAKRERLGVGEEQAALVIMDVLGVK